MPMPRHIHHRRPGHALLAGGWPACWARRLRAVWCGHRARWLAVLAAVGGCWAGGAVAQATAAETTDPRPATAVRWSAGANPLGLGFTRFGLRRGCAPGLSAGASCAGALQHTRAALRSLDGPDWQTEVAVLDTSLARPGGLARARGLGLGVVTRAPLAGGLEAYGRVTALAARTGPTGLDGGRAGVGLSLGAGLRMGLAPGLSAVLAFDRHDLPAAGGHQAVQAASVGLQWRY